MTAPTAPGTTSVSPGYLVLAPGIAVLAALVFLFRDTAVAMVSIWDRSETFAHAFLVPPIVLWMVWRRRALLATLPVKGQPWMLLPMALAGLLWLLGELASVYTATQFALVAMLVLTVPLVYGLPVALALLFPLMFSFFAVPAGEFMVPYMMEWTADFTVAALRLSGVPVWREGLQFLIPTGSWSVVEACSGVRYLIASFMVGTLFAYLNYQSMLRRVVFIIASLLVPILANWLRAYLIVMLGHLSGNQLAAGADHLIYGWVFFGIVIGVMFMVGSRWSEPDAPVPVPVPGAGAATPATGPATSWLAAAAALLLMLGTQGLNWQLNRPHGGPAPQLALAGLAAGPWQAVAQPLSGWEPAFGNASVNARQTFSDGRTQVAVWVAYYRDQNYDRKLVSSGNTLAEQVPEAKWAQVDSGSTRVDTAAGPLPLRTAALRGSPLGSALNAERLRVWQVYWVAGRYVTSDAQAKLLQAVHRLLGRGDDGAAIFYYTPLQTDADAAATADAALARFVAQHHAALDAGLQAVRGRR